MPTFEIEANGKRYQIEAPDMGAAVGMILQQPKSQAPDMGVADYAADAAKSVGRGALEGVGGLAGLPQDFAGFVGSAGNAGLDAALGPSANGPRISLPKILPSSADVIGGIDAATGGALKYEPKTTLGKYGREVGRFVPGAAVFGGPGAVLKYGVAPALASEAAGQATQDTPAEPYARLGAALAGPMAYNAARRVVTPFPTTPDRAGAVDTLRQEGVTGLTAGQMTGNNKLRYMESELGGERAADMLAQQGDQFTAAVLRRAGIAANRATPDVIDGAFTQIGGEFNRLGAGNTLLPDRAFVSDLGAALNWYGGRVSPPNRAPIISNYAQEIGHLAGAGPISGQAYQSLRSRIAADARGAGDQYVAHTLRDLTETLDDAMERSIRSNNPNDLGAWRNAREQYRNLLVIERAAGGAGEQAALGIISPAQLRNATQQVGGRRAYVRGQGDFSELARAGEATMRPMPNSGTASRSAARRLFEFGPMALGAGVGYQAGDLVGALMGTAAGSALPSAVGKALLSAPGRAYLGNSILARQAPATVQELAAALANSSLSARLPPPSR